LEVVCQYSRVPPEWVTMMVFFMRDRLEVLEMQVTGVLSSLIRVYWRDFLEEE
jgi:hypothetical protein